MRIESSVSTTKINMMILAVARMFWGYFSAASTMRKLHTYVELNTPSWDKRMDQSNKENGYDDYHALAKIISLIAAGESPVFSKDNAATS